MRVTFHTEHPSDTIELLQENDLAPRGLPIEVGYLSSQVDATKDWYRLPALQNLNVVVHGDYDDGMISLFRWGVLGLSAVDYSPEKLIRLQGLLPSLPITLAVIGSFHGEWFDRSSRLFQLRAAKSRGFADAHSSHGWACCFKGEGHRRLVSRRWLDHGPWRLRRLANDCSVVEFHDIEVDPETALEQALPGHERMGISDIGGFVSRGMSRRLKRSGLYDPNKRKYIFVIHQGAVSQGEMLDLCEVRYNQALGPDRPVDAVAFEFMDREVARLHLHELWLRELECWTFLEDGQHVRLDLDYEPPPFEKPAWVKRVEARELLSS